VSVEAGIEEATAQCEGEGRTETLFRSEDLLVRVILFEGCTTAFLTFDSYTDNRTLDRPGFGEAYFRDRRISAAHVISRDNRWYQHDEMRDVAPLLKQWSSQFEHVTSYGSSMGGYAALVLGAACGASRGLALSPQFSVDPEIVPFEKRWALDVAQIRFGPAIGLPTLPTQHIAYDPRDAADARHAALFAAKGETIKIRVPWGGHPVGAAINETGLLGTLLERVAAGQMSQSDARIFERELRNHRRQSGQFLTTLAMNLPDRRLAQKVALTELAVKAQPGDPGYLSHHAAMLDLAGRFEEAEQAHLAAMAIPHSGLHPAVRMVNHLLAMGRISEARKLAEELIATRPEAWLPGTLRTRIKKQAMLFRARAWLGWSPFMLTRIDAFARRFDAGAKM